MSWHARAILRAFHYRGRPYDVNFDFLTDSELVCNELVYKAYEPDSHLAGLDLPLTDFLGRKVMSANSMRRGFRQGRFARPPSIPHQPDQDRRNPNI